LKGLPRFGFLFSTLGLLFVHLGCGGAPGAGTPLADGTTVSPSRSLRQGQDGISLAFVSAAGGLSSASAFDLGDLVVERQADTTDTRLVLAVSVPHGAALGARTLTFTGAHGPISASDVVEVGAITSTPAGLDTNLGTPDSPFRTVKRAVQAAGRSDTIQLLDGTYDEAAGETWNYTLPESLTIVGQSLAMTELSGPVANGASAAGTIGLVVPAGLAMKDLSLDFFDTGIDITGPGALVLDNVGMRGHQSAAIRASAPGDLVTLRGGAVSATEDALLLGAPCAACTIDITGTSLSGGAGVGHTIEISATAMGSKTSLHQAVVHGDLFIADTAATLTVVSSAVYENGADARATINFAGLRLDMTDSTITLNANNFGINFQGAALTLSGVTIQGGSYGVYQLSGNSKVRGTKIRDYGDIGYYLAEGSIDLGTQTDPGNNEFSSPAIGPAVFGLYVDGITSPATCSNTTFNGVVPPQGTQAAGSEPIAVPGAYFINYGKTMSFWTL
jgi:hypothetical protein